LNFGLALDLFLVLFFLGIININIKK
jgi:hypothetical protein